MVIPFAGSVGPGSKEDAFNYWFSNCRTKVECGFGELVQRFGVFWRKICLPLEAVPLLVFVCIKLHNACLDDRIRPETAVPLDSYNGRRHRYPDGAGDVSDGFDGPFEWLNEWQQEDAPPVSRSRSAKLSRRAGLDLRSKLCQAVTGAGLARPTTRRDRRNRMRARA